MDSKKYLKTENEQGKIWTPYLQSILQLMVLFTIVCTVGRVEAQQMVVDDAELTNYRSYQIEAWFGSRVSWIMTAVSPFSFLEIGGGIGFDSRDEFQPSNWIIESKFGFGDLENRNVVYGLVSGLLFNFENELEEFFSYIPFTVAFNDQDLLLHLNVGFEVINQVDWEYEIFTGFRSDIKLSDRIALLAEVAALNFQNSFYQGGFRFTIIPDLVEMDFTYGEGFRRMESAPGLNIGLSFTPN